MPELIPAEPGTPEWLAARAAGVTATDIVTILGLSSHDSVYSLFWRKMGQVGDVEDNDRFRLGRFLEPYIAERFTEERALDRLRSSALVRSDTRSWQLATVDRLLDDCPEPVELKSWADADRRSWGQGSIFDDDGTLLVHDGQVPAQVRAQVLWQMDVMDVATGHVGVVFLPSGRFGSYTIDHTACDRVPGQSPAEDCPICWDLCLMRAAGEEFMARLRLELPPPDPDASAATLAAQRARFSRQPAKQAEINPDLWDRYRAACLLTDAHKKIRQEYEIQLREQAGEAAEYTVDGELVARRIVSDAQVKAHTRHQDYIRRVKQGDDSE